MVINAIYFHIFLTQHVDFPTRVASGTSPDLVLSTDDSLVHSVTDCGKLGSSDHSMLWIEVAADLTSSVSMEQVPDWKKADMNKLKEELAGVNWMEEMDGLDANQCWEVFKLKMEKAQDAAIPKKMRRVGSRPVWMTKNVMRVIRKKRRLWKNYKESKDYEEYMAYKTVEKKVKDSVRNAKKRFEKNLAKDVKKNPKAFYSYLKSKTSNRQSVGPLKKDGKVVSDDEEQADILNQFFASVFTEEDLSNLPQLGPFEKGEPLSNVQFTEEKIKEKIEKLRSSAAPGPDGICPRVLQGVVEAITGPLAIIYTRSMEEGIVPTDWRTANITPIFKKGSKSAAGNYRPVSLTSILCRVMEAIVRDMIMEHLEKWKLILNGLMPAKSCLTNQLEYL